MALQMPSALARSAGSANTWRTMDKETGVSMQPPTAWTILHPVSMKALVAARLAARVTRPFQP